VSAWPTASRIAVIAALTAIARQRNSPGLINSLVAVRISRNEGVQAFHSILVKLRNETEEMKKIGIESFQRREQSAERLRAL